MACAPARVAWTDAICLGAKAPENVGLIEVEVSFCGSERGLTILITKSCILHCDWLLDRTSWQQDGTRGSATECVLAIYMQQNKSHGLSLSCLCLASKIRKRNEANIWPSWPDFRSIIGLVPLPFDFCTT